MRSFVKRLLPRQLPQANLNLRIALHKPIIFRNSVRWLVTQTHYQRYPLKNDGSAFGIEMKFAAKPLPDEAVAAFKTRVVKVVSQHLFDKRFANHELVMVYPTRVATKDEKISNVFKPILPGHCLSTWIDKDGQPNPEYTVSLRPDMKQPEIYRAETAPDNRFPNTAQAHKTVVRPARHSTPEEEISRWAEDVYMQVKSHSDYPLHCLFRPIQKSHQSRYSAVIKEIKLTYNRYSLLAHKHPYTGCGLDDIVDAENCTVISKVLEREQEVNVKEVLGYNPSPQLVMQLIKRHYLTQAAANELSDDDILSKPFRRSY